MIRIRVGVTIGVEFRVEFRVGVEGWYPPP